MPGTARLAKGAISPLFSPSMLRTVPFYPVSYTHLDVYKRQAYGISYDYFNRVGSALEGINAPQALFGVISQSIPPGGPVPANFLITKNSFTTGIDNPSNFNPLVSNVVYLPPNSPWPYIQTWFAGIQQEITKSTIFEIDYNGNHSLDLPIIADYNQAAPNAPGGTLSIAARVPIPTFGPITWVDPVGNNNYNGLSLRAEHRFTDGLYLSLIHI